MESFNNLRADAEQSNSSSGLPAVSASNLSPKTSRSAQGAATDTFGCHLCPKVFNRRENLSRHLKTHDSPSHTCSRCGKAFTRSDLLKRHELGHERWDKKEPAKRNENASAKKRKIGAENPSQSPASLNTSSSIPENPGTHVNTLQPHGHPNQSIQYGYTPQMAALPNSQYQTENRGPPLVEPTNNYQTFPIQQQFTYRPSEGSNQGQYAAHHQPQTHHVPEQTANFGHFDIEGDTVMNFDFSSFLLPNDLGPSGHEWFSYDFYSAIRENGNEWGNEQGDLLDPNLLTPSQDQQADSIATNHQPRNQEPEPNLNTDVEQDAQYNSSEEDQPENGRISRVSSPPNEASEEDKWPFQWNPNSVPILKANPITIPADHPLIQSHNPRFDISEQTLLKLRAFLTPPSGREFHQSQKGSFTVPALPVINIFIRLFFEHFSVQMPVLHHPTVDTNTDLPPPLLAVMVVLGAIYSHLKHTRRFAIVLLDIVRWHLQIALECDNSLMRDPMIIYAEALVCHTGIWCGNKRAFELAEVVRGALVTYIRRVNLMGWPVPSAEHTVVTKGNIQSEWKSWVIEESQRRLYWIIYGIDCQFPSLLNLPATIAIGEVSNLLCPCDEEFWCATSARNWKNLLGPASVPPSRAFSAAVGPFILKSFVSGAEQVEETMARLRRAQIGRGMREGLPKLDLNPWSAFLVLMTLQNQIYQFSQESVLARTFMGDEDGSLSPSNDLSEHGLDSGDAMSDTIKMLKKLQNIRRGQLSEALSSWSRAYLNPSRSTSHPSSLHFHASSVVIHHLSDILLDIPLSDLQSALGKDGTTGIAQAMSSLTSWARRSPGVAEEVAYNSVRTIVSLAPKKGIDKRKLNTKGEKEPETIPYSIITLFLCHVVLWVFATVCERPQKGSFLRAVAANEVLRTSPFFSVLRRAMALDEEPQGLSEREKLQRRQEAPKIMFKCAAETLTRLGTWGVSLNLALMLHQRAEM